MPGANFSGCHCSTTHLNYGVTHNALGCRKGRGKGEDNTNPLFFASGRREILSPSYPRRLAISLRVEICFETLDLKEAKALLGTLTL